MSKFKLKRRPLLIRLRNHYRIARPDGQRRTNADKRKAVMTLLEDGEWSQWSDREIARHTRVDHTTVGRIRASLVESTSDEVPPRTYTTRHGTTATMNTSNIGRRCCASNGQTRLKRLPATRSNRKTKACGKWQTESRPAQFGGLGNC